MRWSPRLYEETWPVFLMPNLHSNDPGHRFSDIFIPALPYTQVSTSLVVIVGRFHSSKFVDLYDISYHQIMRTNKIAARLCGFNKNDLMNAQVRSTTFCTQYLYQRTSVSVLFYYSMIAHTVFCAALLVGSAWNGFKIYVRYRRGITKRR